MKFVKYNWDFYGSNYLRKFGYNINMRKIVKSKYFITTILVGIIYFIYLKMMDIYPFGEYSILKSDLYQQYINFFCYLREVILNGKSIVISWNLGLANNFYTTFAYYLISPLNLLVVFFNYSNIDIFVEIITFIKIELMANFFILFLEKSYKYKEKEAILFGLIYAFSSYVICYSFHIMWLDCLYMLPIVLLFVDKYLENCKIWPFIVSLSYAILTNYYIGYIVAFFAGIYYLVRLFTIKKQTCNLEIYEKHIRRSSGKIEKTRNSLKIIKNISKFLFGILISFGIGMIVILPSLLQLKGKMSADIEFIKIDIDKLRLFINVIFNNYVYMFTQKSCLMFSSTLVILLLPMYYLNKKINWKEKLGFSAIIVFLLLPIISPFLNKLWHCFTTPNCFNYRYSFTLILTLILIAAREFQNKEYSKKWHFIISILVFSTLTAIQIIFMQKGYLQSDNYTVSINSILLSCVIYFIMIVLVYIIFLYDTKCSRDDYCFAINSLEFSNGCRDNNIKNKINLKLNNGKVPTILFEKSSKKIIKYFLTCFLFIIVTIDLLIGAKSGQNNNDKYFKREYFLQYDKFMEHFMQKIEVPETERIVFMPDNYGSNMSLKYGYSNIGFFTSARNRESLKAMYRLGYNVQRDEELWITSFSGTFLNYSMAGVKYYITKEELEENEIYGFEFEEKYDDFYVYKNRNAFDIGYYLAENIEESYNPFKMQNEILNALMNQDTEEKEYFQNIENSEFIICEKEQEFNESDKEYTIKYKLKSKKDCNIYFQSDYNLQIYINDVPQFLDYSNIWSTETGIKQIKHLKEDEEFEFTIKTKQNLELLYIYASDNEEIQNILDKKEERNKFTNVKINKNGLTGIANFKDDGYLVFGIAYDDCWDIYVDGKQHDTEAIAGSFLGVKLEKGIHNIEIKATLF